MSECRHEAPLRVTGDVLRWLRLREGMTRKQAAAKIGVGPWCLKNWETGAELPSWIECRVMQSVYGCSLAVMFLPATNETKRRLA